MHENFDFFYISDFIQHVLSVKCLLCGRRHRAVVKRTRGLGQTGLDMTLTASVCLFQPPSLTELEAEQVLCLKSMLILWL